VDVETSSANGRLLAYLAAHGEVLSRQFDGDRAVIHVRIPQRHLGSLAEEGTTIQPHAYTLAEKAPEPSADVAQEVA
jgi:GTP-binding protein HflX